MVVANNNNNDDANAAMSTGHVEVEPVFILAGQSNMAGRCEERCLPEKFRRSSPYATNVPHSSFPEVRLCWNNDSNFGPPFSIGEWGDLRCQPSPGLDNKILFGPEFGLAETLGERFYSETMSRVQEEQRTSIPPLPKRMHFIKFAMGSTNLHSNWNPSNTTTATEEDGVKPAKRAHYQEFIEYCRESLNELTKLSDSNDDEELIDSSSSSSSIGEKQKEEGSSSCCSLPTRKAEGQRKIVVPRLTGMFWLQGESDSSKARDAKKYLSNFQSFITAVRRDLQAPDLPVVVSPVVWRQGKYVDLVNEALKEAGKGAVPNCVCIDELDTSLYGVQPAEAGAFRDHLTWDGVIDIGRRMGKAFPISQ